MAIGSIVLLFDLDGEERRVVFEFLFGLEDTSFMGVGGSATSWLEVLVGFGALFRLGCEAGRETG
jgi:hypothetical protein